ncbi:MAG: undecaprenyl-diphosphate phosphatase [Planctomycetes bacterium]|nr:undecaprenyl-diphosphate phosphatase [Planctomycetota bacterium]
MHDGLKAAVLGAVQGITEFLPVSSSAHLLSLRHVLGFEAEGIAFDLSVHLATLVAVLIYFRRLLLGLLVSREGWSVLLRVAVATLPAVAAGVLFAEDRENVGPWAAVCGWSFSSAYLLLSRGRAGPGSQASLPYGRAVLIGFAQALAIFPGVSRSGSTIAAGLWLGLSREEAARFSFLLAIPATLGAVCLEAYKLLGSRGSHEGLWAAAGIGMPVAFAVGIASIHVLLRIVRGSHFHHFGWYNLLAAAAFGAYLLAARAAVTP